MDLGTKRVGLAITNPWGSGAYPLPFLPYISQAHLIQDLKKIVEEKGVNLIVAGLPVSLNGALGPKALECKKFADKIQKELKKEVTLFDESFTTQDAEEILIGELNVSRKKRRKLKDSLAACILLESYMNSKRFP